MAKSAQAATSRAHRTRKSAHKNVVKIHSIQLQPVSGFSKDLDAAEALQAAAFLAEAMGGRSAREEQNSPQCKAVASKVTDAIVRPGERTTGTAAGAEVQWRVITKARFDIMKPKADTRFKMSFALMPNGEIFIDKPGPAGVAAGVAESDVVLSINDERPISDRHAVELMWDAPVGTIAMVVARSGH